MNKVIGIEEVNGKVMDFENNIIIIKPVCYNPIILKHYMDTTKNTTIMKNGVGISLKDILHNDGKMCFGVHKSQFNILKDTINEIDDIIYKKFKESNPISILQQIERIEKELTILKGMLKD